VLRLHPLYLLSAAAMLVPFLVGAGGDMAAQGWPDWWPHFFYLNGVMERPWLMQIYWTLALEAQYYLAIGLVFPLLAHRQALVRGGALLVVMLVPLVAHAGRTVLPFAALFGMGVHAPGTGADFGIGLQDAVDRQFVSVELVDVIFELRFAGELGLDLDAGTKRGAQLVEGDHVENLGGGDRQLVFFGVVCNR
jgi:peptidoglycan/LPS O-acetylase OafA/YrhL